MLLVGGAGIGFGGKQVYLALLLAEAGEFAAVPGQLAAVQAPFDTGQFGIVEFGMEVPPHGMGVLVLNFQVELAFSRGIFY